MKQRSTVDGKRMPGESASTSRWLAWRQTRTNAIASPPRNKAAQRLNGSGAKT